MEVKMLMTLGMHGAQSSYLLADLAFMGAHPLASPSPIRVKRPGGVVTQ